MSLSDLEVLDSGLLISGQDLLHTLDLPRLRSIGIASRGSVESVETGLTEPLRLGALVPDRAPGSAPS